MPFYFGIFHSPVGPLSVVTSEPVLQVAVEMARQVVVESVAAPANPRGIGASHIKILSFGASAAELQAQFSETLIIQNSLLLKNTFHQLDEYFAGRREVFDLPLSPEGTEFQKKAWRALQTIPYGETISYQEQAERLGSPKAVRAVGGANNKNPIAVIIPCHRVIGKNGALVGFGGGLSNKEILLKLEGRTSSLDPDVSPLHPQLELI